MSFVSFFVLGDVSTFGANHHRHLLFIPHPRHHNRVVSFASFASGTYLIHHFHYFLFSFNVLIQNNNNITRNLCLTSSWPIVLMIKRNKIFKVVNWFVTTLIKTFFQSSNTFKDLEINVSGNALEVVKRIIMRLFHAVAKFILTIKMKSEESKR